jgi:uncharacterized membrane protein YbhN (UPF0104 family)
MPAGRYVKGSRLRAPASAPSTGVRWWLGVTLLVLAVCLLVPAVEVAVLGATARRALSDPLALLAVLAAYLAAFALRARLWTLLLPGVGFGHALAALHVALAGNHVLPLRLGEVLRVTSVTRRTGVPFAAAAASTVTLRAADVLAVVGLAAALGPRAAAGLVGTAGWLLMLPAVALWIAGAWWLRRVTASRGVAAARPGTSAVVGVGALAAWLLESALVWQAAHWAGVALGPLDAVLVTAVTIMAQTVAVAPGGLGTYEAAGTAALVALGAPAPAALAAAVAAHAVKTAYALLAGAAAAVVPAPGLLGRLRLPRARPRPATPVPVPVDAPVVLFLPAHDEEAAVAGVVARVPAEVCGRRVRCLVIDDGSTDATAARAAAAGATVVSLGRNRGLGAAVRRGLAEGVAAGAAAVAFCDADAEYAPEELERLVAPLLDGRADYVVGSRFAGDIGRMLPHRRLGNRLLTLGLRLVARTPIGDGQSGYRALSRAAAAAAEIVHDYNYAQVLTLDLLGKGFRYAEVPISYRFRATGRSYIRLGRYLRRVLPAVHRELNAPSGPRPVAPSPSRSGAAV